ncbi:hypothetical protein FRB94_003536 [Tulasnella sp. JGI-2019a]|nr:hypothetical protein FRB93_001103 [Tulasnella sp. JGI-2019a]KAG9002853.1 hypothetical protein FRB94_003536 [Tulasnella sp. JGI-2019a]
MPDIKISATPSVKFAGAAGEDISLFLQDIQQEAFRQGRQREDAWIADYALTILRGRALIWYYSLDEESQSSWKKLRVAIITKFGTAALPSDSGPSQMQRITETKGPSPEPLLQPPEYTEMDPLAQAEPGPSRGSPTVPRHTQSMITARPHTVARPSFHRTRSESTGAMLTSGYAPLPIRPPVRQEPAATPLIPARRGYIKLVASLYGKQQLIGWVGAGKRWDDIKKNRNKAVFVEIPAFYTSQQSPWEMKIINPVTGLQERGGQILHVLGPDSERSSIAGFTWSFTKDPSMAPSRVYAIRRNCWMINDSQGEEEFSVVWKYKDDKKDLITALERRSAFSSEGMILRSQHHTPTGNEFSLRMLFEEASLHTSLR